MDKFQLAPLGSGVSTVNESVLDKSVMMDDFVQVIVLEL